MHRGLSHYRFCFGYHEPEDWEATLADPNWDCESSGALVILAENETAAFHWGIEVVRWYLGRLQSGAPKYTWTPDDYAAWIEQMEAASAFDEELLVHCGALPNFDAFADTL